MTETVKPAPVAPGEARTEEKAVETNMQTSAETSTQSSEAAERDNGAACAPEKPRAATRTPAREIDAKTLFSNDRELVILHNDQRYVLRLTRLNKLILTK